MNWISYILGISLIILAVVLIWWEYRLKYHFDDGRTITHKNWRKRVLWLTLGLFVLNQINSLQKDNQAKSDKQELTRQINYLTNQLSTVNSNQSTLQRQHQSLLNELATNSFISLDLRQRIIDNNRQFEVVDSQVGDLNAWADNLRRRATTSRIQSKLQREKHLNALQSGYQDNIVYYDYAITSLTRKLGNAAVLNADKVVSDYHGLPTMISLDVGEINVAEVKFQKNADWDFKVFFEGIQVDGRRHLIIKNKCGSLEISASVAVGLINTYVHLPEGETIPNENKPIMDYKKVIDDGEELLIGAAFDQFSSTNK